MEERTVPAESSPPFQNSETSFSAAYRGCVQTYELACIGGPLVYFG